MVIELSLGKITMVRVRAIDKVNVRMTDKVTVRINKINVRVED